MAKKQTLPPLLECAALAEELADKIENVSLLWEENAHKEIIADLCNQLKATKLEMISVSKRLRRMQTLNEHKAGSYLILDGEVIRPATPDEIVRQVMHYPAKGTSVLALLNDAKSKPDTIKEVFRE